MRHNPEFSCPAIKPPFCGCGRTGSADPPRKEGRASHAYRRLVFLALSDGEARWCGQAGERVVHQDTPPYWKVVPAETPHSHTRIP